MDLLIYLYASARSKNSDVFRLLFGCKMKPECLVGENEEDGKSNSGNLMVFREEMMNKAVHAAARGGNLEILEELPCKESLDVLEHRDVNCSTIVHAASGSGQLEENKKENYMEIDFRTTAIIHKQISVNFAQNGLYIILACSWIASSVLDAMTICEVTCLFDL